MRVSAHTAAHYVKGAVGQVGLFLQIDFFCGRLSADTCDFDFAAILAIPAMSDYLFPLKVIVPFSPIF
jgi:hypothetical protein